MFSNKYIITKVVARQILDSRGTPTLEAEVFLSGGASGFASVPSGASTGNFEAFELRDNQKDFYFGKSVSNAVLSVNSVLSEALIWKDASNQTEIDKTMCNLDETENKSRLGANAILAVSLAVSRAVSNAQKIPLYRYLGGSYGSTLPVPMMNILNGGRHASNNLDIQEFMIVPSGVQNFSDAIRCGCEIYNSLKKILIEKNLSVAVGDEGGFAPNLESDTQALELIIEATDKAGYKMGSEVFIALDAAASEWFAGDKYIMPKRKSEFSKQKLCCFFEELCLKYPIISIEDPFFEEDFEWFSELTRKIGNKVQIVGDDLFVTNKTRLLKGVLNGSANCILIKPNQIGSLSEVFDTVRTANFNGYKTIMSHRSGETEDSFIADLAVALNCGQVKMGAPCRSDRTAKYNRLLKIESELGGGCYYGDNILR